MFPNIQNRNDLGFTTIFTIANWQNKKKKQTQRHEMSGFGGIIQIKIRWVNQSN